MHPILVVAESSQSAADGDQATHLHHLHLPQHHLPNKNKRKNADPEERSDDPNYNDQSPTHARSSCTSDLPSSSSTRSVADMADTREISALEALVGLDPDTTTTTTTYTTTSTTTKAGPPPNRNLKHGTTRTETEIVKETELPNKRKVDNGLTSDESSIAYSDSTPHPSDSTGGGSNHDHNHNHKTNNTTSLLLSDKDQKCKSQEETWNTRIQELQDFKSEQGHVMVPHFYDGNQGLGQWVKRQRYQHKLRTEGKRSAMTDQRMAELEALGFVWNTNTDAWEQRFAELSVYFKTHGHCNISANDPDHKPMGVWVKVQRRQYQLFQQGDKKSNITKDRIHKLESIGFEFKPSLRTNDSRENSIANPNINISMNMEHRQAPFVCPSSVSNDTSTSQISLSNNNNAMLQSSQESSNTHNDVSSSQTLSSNGSQDDLSQNTQLLEAHHHHHHHQTSSEQDLWKTRILQLKEFQQKRCHCAIPNHFEANLRLGEWAKQQRQQYVLKTNGKENTLTDAHAAELTTIGFVWSTRDVAWEESFQQLCRFQDVEGDCRVPAQWHRNPELSDWVTQQRRQFQDLMAGAHSSTISAEQIRRLSRIGFEWDMQHPRLLPNKQTHHPLHGESKLDDVVHTPLRNKQGGDDHSDIDAAMHDGNSGMYEESDEESSDDESLLDVAWEAKFTELQAYKRSRGNCHVPTRFQENVCLSQWTQEQRQAYQKLLREDDNDNDAEESSSMTPYRIRKLSALGLDWNPSSSNMELKFDEATNPGALNGGTEGPVENIIKKQKQDITKKQIDTWNSNFHDLVRFREKYRHCMVPVTYEENPGLGPWVKRQRYQYKLQKEGRHSALTAVRREELDQIGMVWNSHDIVWEEKLEQLRAYKEQYGDCRVPTTFPEHPQLAVWVKIQRRQFKLYIKGDKKSSMTPERINKLQEMGFEFNPRKLKS
jgi:hypothetical protein